MISKILFCVAALAATVSGAGAAAGSESKLVLTGSSTVAPLISEIAKRFESKHPGVKIDVQSGGSSRGITDARQGLADIGMVSRTLKPDEGDLTAHTVALDGIGVIVHRTNPIKTLSTQQVVAIYSGNIKNWKELGGPDLRITVVNKAEGRSTLELFMNYFKLTSSQIKAHVVIGDNQQGIKTVAGNRGAIGYVSIGSGEFEQQQGTPIKLLAMVGIVASAENIKNGKYPLMRPLNLVTKAQPSALAGRFIAFARSSAVGDLVKEQFFVAPDLAR